MTTFAIVLALWLLGMPGLMPEHETVVSESPLTAEQLEVYSAFLDSYLGEASENLGDRTVRFHPSDIETAEGYKGCLEGIELELQELEGARQVVHFLPAEIVTGRKLKLVDETQQLAKVREINERFAREEERTPEFVNEIVEEVFAAGLLRLSEIVFDKTRRFAVMTYHFYCGELCGHWATVVLEKKGDKWEKTNRTCPGGIS